jgi:hypothetical protein
VETGAFFIAFKVEVFVTSSLVAGGGEKIEKRQIVSLDWERVESSGLTEKSFQQSYWVP